MTPSSPRAAFSSGKPLEDAERFRKHQFRSEQFEWLARRLGRVSNIAAAPIEPSEALGWLLGDLADVGVSVVRSHVARAASRSNRLGRASAHPGQSYGLVLGRIGNDLTPRSRESVLYRYLSMFTSCVT
jgi:hypothetical protein